MPVTAKLSKQFYDRFGEAVTNELVDWFNQVDAAYKSDIRDMNELNFARFDAKLEQRFAEFDAKLEQRFAEFDAKLEQRFAKSDAKVEHRFAAVDARFAAVDARFVVADANVDRRIAELREGLTRQLATFETRIVRWMFTLWTTTMVALAGLLLAVLRSK
jgi:CRP-like cAMP-binding protein